MNFRKYYNKLWVYYYNLINQVKIKVPKYFLFNFENIMLKC